MRMDRAYLQRMSLYIRNEVTDRLARELARRTQLFLTEAVRRALEAELARVPAPGASEGERRMAIMDLQAQVAAMPLVEGTTEVDLYDEHGLPR